MAAAKNDPRIDELRQQLRSLGYLDAGVDRFVLGAARDARSAAAIAWLAGLRIGALAAVLMGPAAAIGISARIPGLITGARDGFVVAAYMGVLFGAAVFVAASLASLSVAWLSRRQSKGAGAGRRRAALAAGAVVTIACLAYLTLWWDASALGQLTGTRNITWTLLGLAFAAGVSLLLGHLVTVASLAVSVAATGMGREAHGVPGAARGVMTIAGVMAFCGALLLFTLTGRFDAAGAEPPPLTVVSSGVRVRLLAIDGFDPEIGRRLAREGRIPYLSASLRLGAGGDAIGSGLGARATMQIEDVRDPARVWTTIATGQPASVHAVRGLETRRVVGVQGTLAAAEPSPLSRALAATTDLLRLTHPAIASGDERRVKTLWEVASDAGLRTAVINWWATWPAPSNSGIVITDRATLRLERGGSLDAEIAPAEQYQMLRSRWPDIRQAAADRAKRIQRIDRTGSLLRRSAELDGIQLAITREVSSATTDLTCTYLSGLDVAQHALLTTGGRTALSPSAMAERLEALDEYYVILDGLLAEMAEVRTGEVTVILTSPGRVQSSAAGMLTINGSIATARAGDVLARPTDVMPTVLHALGVPVSRDLAGRPLVELFSAEFARRYPVRAVETYGLPMGKQVPRSGTPLDQEMIDRLRSLGYVR